MLAQKERLLVVQIFKNVLARSWRQASGQDVCVSEYEKRKEEKHSNVWASAVG